MPQLGVQAWWLIHHIACAVLPLILSYKVSYTEAFRDVPIVAGTPYIRSKCMLEWRIVLEDACWCMLPEMGWASSLTCWHRFLWYANEQDSTWGIYHLYYICYLSMIPHGEYFDVSLLPSLVHFFKCIKLTWFHSYMPLNNTFNAWHACYKCTVLQVYRRNSTARHMALPYVWYKRLPASFILLRLLIINDIKGFLRLYTAATIRSWMMGIHLMT